MTEPSFGSTPRRPVRLELVTRHECGLCDEMKRSIELVTSELGASRFELVEVDVDREPELLARYGEHVPVLLVEGDEAFRHRADAPSLRERLRQASGL